MSEKEYTYSDMIDLMNVPNYTPLSWYKDFIYTLRTKLANVRVFFRDIKIGIQNLFTYIPVIWRLRYWDFEYVLDLWEAQFKNMRDNFVKNDITEESKQIGIEIDTLFDIIDRYRKFDEYYEQEHQEDIKNISICTDKDRKHELIRNFYTKMHMNEIKSYNVIFDYIKENSRKWWD